MEPNVDPNAEADPQPPAADDTSSRPTHHLEDVKVGDHGVQLLVSTKDHVYDAKNIEAGENSWQVVGAWNDAAVQVLAKMLMQRQSFPSREASRYSTTYGTGHTIGVVGNNNRGTVGREGSE